MLNRYLHTGINTPTSDSIFCMANIKMKCGLTYFVVCFGLRTEYCKLLLDHYRYYSQLDLHVFL